tara:strand:+ start:4709 stop:5239 length:531 start_codon:yes stop_codon:yes gene_type:complete
MNIFALEKKNNTVDWTQSALSHDDYRCNKMIIESCQMLSTTAKTFGYVTRYKMSHLNHPSTIWARESLPNFKHLLHLASALRMEFGRRHKKDTHGCDDVILQMMTFAQDRDFATHFPSKYATELPLCMPDEYKSADVVESYRNYFSNKPNLRYYHTTPPSWIADYRSQDLPPIQIR